MSYRFSISKYLKLFMIFIASRFWESSRETDGSPNSSKYSNLAFCPARTSTLDEAAMHQSGHVWLVHDAIGYHMKSYVLQAKKQSTTLEKTTHNITHDITCIITGTPTRTALGQQIRKDRDSHTMRQYTTCQRNVVKCVQHHLSPLQVSHKFDFKILRS